MTAAPRRLSLGIDTGGTYTDAVLFDEASDGSGGVVAKSKALTTRHDLAIGIADAVGAVLAQHPDAEVALVSLSTTLATNALVEGRGGRVALIFIGFNAGDERRAGLLDALGGDPVVCVAGGHDPQGEPLAVLDDDAIAATAADLAGSVSGFAITSQFATRNPEHELAAREILARTGIPVTCGHELSAKLNGPRRAVTSVLNARLIGLITSLIAAAESIMHRHGIDAPLMVVRGDGSLMSAAVAMARPIETILSGPAASLVGAAFLTGVHDAIVADIGGTTTDVAVVENGSPHLDDHGATVGGFQTMVEAVAMTTVGLGGDSEVVVGDRDVAPALRIGPRRMVPISLLATTHSTEVHAALDRQLLDDLPGEHDARFVVPGTVTVSATLGLTAAEADLLERARVGVAPVGRLILHHADVGRLDRLVQRGLVQLSAFTPTDAAHVLGLHDAFDARAAAKAATLMARKRSILGKPVATDAAEMSTWVVDTLRRRSAELLLDVGLGIDGFDIAAAHNPLLAASLDGRRGVVDVSARLTVPVIGLGASAATHYPAIASLVRTEGIVPADADVANAIGAVVGRVRVHADVYIAQIERGRFRVHDAHGHHDVFTVEDAVASAARVASSDATARAEEAGADHADVTVRHVLNVAHIEGEEYVVDGTVTATASGRPRIGHPRPV